MPISFHVLTTRGKIDTKLREAVQLVPDNWDDYSYKTLFVLHYTNANGVHSELGSVKIGHKGQEVGMTLEVIPKLFEKLSGEWFSVGQDVEYYKLASQNLSSHERCAILGGLRDVAFLEDALTVAQNESVFITSLLRGVSTSVIHGQYRRILSGGTVLTDFDFKYLDPGGERHSPVELDFKVKASSKPPTNVHVLIGRNGIGKTTILNGMVRAVHPDYIQERTSSFSSNGLFHSGNALPEDYFSGVVSVSFSVFDPFVPPPDNAEPKKGLKYFYIGMKKVRLGDTLEQASALKSEADLINDFLAGFNLCMSQEAKARRWVKAIERLSSDANFAAMELPQLAEIEQAGSGDINSTARKKLSRMSSGHKIVLLTITALVNLTEEKTLVLMDEPETHLHPPLLSAFTRALSELLHDRNGVAIVATHSPVVVQEVPSSCVWILNRSGLEWRKDRPVRETFAENVGILTKEVFGLEVSKSGFHAMFQEAVYSGLSFDEILNEFSGKIGMEGMSILMAMIAARDAENDGGSN
ncbi:ATP-binding protein [Alcaligenes faecalis subsp. faecalis]|uniref:AAA family ATPase n=1 Tax=Alcaligenes faecalis TaxID=511 RepID=UPI001F379984|nr:AAA family ATPase [Alcaligenes faecalis]MBW4789369.1 ATP-binding protein [Alcaligenes faecalis subsp. faecalis]